MNKKKFLKELDNLKKNRSLTPYKINELFKSKKSIFNDVKIDVLIKENFKNILIAIPKGNVDVVINTLYRQPEMKEFLKKEDTIKMMLDECEYHDFKSLIADSDINEYARDFINNNFDYVIENYELKKVVSIFEYVDLNDENKEKMNDYFKNNKEGFLKEILTTTLSIRGNLSEKESENLIKIVTKITDETLKHENAKVSDIKTLQCGSFSSVIRIGDTIIKVGMPRKTFDMPNDQRVLQPHLRRNLEKELGIKAVIEVADRVETDFNISEEELYSVYKDMRDRGVVCGDFKYGNIGKLLKDNPPRNNPNHGLHGNVNKTLKAGDYVLIDTDFVYNEDDPNVELSSDMSIQFEKRYLKEKGIINEDNREKKESVKIVEKRGR